jgi:hypothetical protein
MTTTDEDNHGDDRACRRERQKAVELHARAEDFMPALLPCRGRRADGRGTGKVEAKYTVQPWEAL